MSKFNKKEYFKLYYKKNEVRIKKAQRGYYLKDKEKCKKRATEFNKKKREENPEKFYKDAYARQTKFRKSPKGTYQVIVKRCRRYPRYSLEMTQKEFLSWYDNEKKECVFCKLPEKLLYLVSSRGGTDRFSIDRVDNAKGYSLNNIQLCCLTCNRVKSDIFSNTQMQKLAKLFITPIWKKKLYQ